MTAPSFPDVKATHRVFDEIEEAAGASLTFTTTATAAEADVTVMVQ